MIDFATPTTTSQALAIFRAMREVKITNPGGDDLRPAEVVATIGTNHLFYTKEYCVAAQQRDGLFSDYDFSNGTPFWLENMATGKLVPINAMHVGAEQLLAALAA